MKFYFTLILFFVIYDITAQYEFCPIELNWAGVACQTFTSPNNFVVKDIVRDFHADVTGRKNSHQAFECAAAYFNKRGGNGRLIIPYGKYMVGSQKFLASDSNLCNYSNYYGWVGRDLMHLMNCKNLEIIGINKKGTGELPFIYFQSNMKVGGFSKAGLASVYTSFDTTEKRYRLPNNCIESKKRNTYTAFPGSFFWFEDCVDVTITNISIDGNMPKAKLGSYNGTGVAPYELWGYGVVVWNTREMTCKNVRVTNQCTDGILIKNYTDSGEGTKSYNVQLSNVNVSKSGRNNVSWVGGNGLFIDNCSFSLAGSGKIKTDPGAGLDIEPENHEARFSKCSYKIVNGNRVTVNDICMNSTIKNSDFSQNRLSDLLIVSDSTRIKNASFINCLFTNSNQWALTLAITKSLSFVNCKIYGKWYVQNIQLRDAAASQTFINCLFKDKP